MLSLYIYIRNTITKRAYSNDGCSGPTRNFYCLGFVWNYNLLLNNINKCIVYILCNLYIPMFKNKCRTFQHLQDSRVVVNLNWYLKLNYLI